MTTLVKPVDDSQSGGLFTKEPAFFGGSNLVAKSEACEKFTAMLREDEIPNRIFIHGPEHTGVKQLTLMLARHYSCEKLTLSGEQCGQCENCKRQSEERSKVKILMGDQLTSKWGSVTPELSLVRDRSNDLIILRDIHSLPRDRQHELYDLLESTVERVVITATATDSIIDPLMKCCSPYVFQTRYSTAEEALQQARIYAFKADLCVEPGTLERVVGEAGYIHSVFAEDIMMAFDGELTHDFLDRYYQED